MAQKKGYALVPQDVPGRRRSSFYQLILDEFRRSSATSVSVEGTGKKPVTLIQGLRKAIEVGDDRSIGVVQRGQKIFLVKVD